MAASAPLGAQATSGAVRRCLATATRQEKAALVRFVVGPDGVLVPDVGGRLPGRGLWLSADAGALQRASRKGLFARALKMPVTLPEDLAAEVERQLLRRCLDLISFARRSGAAVCGFDRTKAWLASGKAGIVCTARDAGAGSSTPPVVPGTDTALQAGRVDVLTADELGAVFGRPRVAHAAIARGRLAERIRIEAHRLAGFRRAGGVAGGFDTADDWATLVATDGR